MKRFYLFFFVIFLTSIILVGSPKYGASQNISFSSYFGLMARNGVFIEDTLLLIINEHSLDLYNTKRMDSIFLEKNLWYCSSPDFVADYYAVYDSILILEGNDSTYFFNISDMNNVFEEASIPAEKNTYNVIVFGDYAYVGDDSSIFVYDLSDFPNVSKVDSVQCSGKVRSMLLSDTILFVNEGGNLTVYSTSDSSSLEYIAYHFGEMDTYSPIIDGGNNIIYIFANTIFGADIYALDITDVLNITEMGSVSVNDYLFGLDAVGDSLLIASSTQAIYIYSSSDPSVPMIVPTDESNYWITNYERNDSVFLYSWGLEYGLSVYYISDAVTADKIFKSNTTEYSFLLTGKNDTLFVKNSYVDNFYAVDFTDKNFPKQLCMLKDGLAGRFSDYKNEILVLNDTSLFYTQENELTVLNVSNPSNIITEDVMSITSPFDFIQSNLNPNLIYLTSLNDLYTLDISDMSDIQIIKDIPSYGLGDIALKDTFIYVAGEDCSLKIFTASSPTNMIYIKTVRDDYFGTPGHIEINDTFMFIGSFSNSSNGLSIFSIADPLNPQFLGNYYEDEGDYDFGVYISDMQLYHDSLIYVAKPDFGIVVYNVKNPSNILKTAFYEMDSYFYNGTYAVYVDEENVYATGEFMNLYCLNDDAFVTGTETRDNVFSKRKINSLCLKSSIIKASLEFEYCLKRDGDVYVDIYDAQGRKMKNIIKESQTEGAHTIKHDCSMFPSGTYFLKGYISGTSFSMKILKVD